MDQATASPIRVAGIDRWRGGWVVAELSTTGLTGTGLTDTGLSSTGLTGDSLTLSTSVDVSALCESLSSCAAVAIDMPIALAIEGRRTAESEVRQALGSSARSVFTSPTRAAVEALTQAAATELNRANGGPGISAQAFGLFASIRELRSALRGEEFSHWHETHPETSFAAMNQGKPLASKRSALGVSQRLGLLRKLFPTVDEWLTHSPPKVPIDDVLDAIAAAWSARRISTDTADLYGPEGRDDQGFALGIRI